MDFDRWNDARAAMLLPEGVTYLNTGSYGITPRIVFERVTDLRRQMQSEPVDFLWRQQNQRLWHARQRLAEFVHGDPTRLMFTANVTVAINIVASSLQLAAPGEVLMTNHEYGSMRFAWERATQRQGLTLRAVALPTPAQVPAEIVQAVTSAYRPETRLLFLSHVCYTTGTVLPVKEICAAARQRGILTVVDGAHAPGMIGLHLEDLGCDFYGANLHKWLLAPLGAGFLYFAPGNQDRLQPMVTSWGWYYDRSKADERDEHGSTPRLRSFEFEGSRDICPWLAVPTAIEFHERLGADNIRQRHRELGDHVRAKIPCSPGGLKLVTPELPGLRGGLTAYQLPPIDITAFRKALWEIHRLEVPVIEHREGNFLRVSTHFYNTKEEIDRLAAVLPELLQQVGG
jgi:isopenicillin-N epimerase